MTLSKITTVSRIEVLETGVVQVCILDRVLEDGIEISAALKRHVISPGDDYSEENDRVRAICACVHTADVVVAYQSGQSTNPAT